MQSFGLKEGLTVSTLGVRNSYGSRVQFFLKTFLDGCSMRQDPGKTGYAGGSKGASGTYSKILEHLL